MQQEAPRDSGFLAALKHAIATASNSAKARAARTVTVGNVRVPVGRASPLVPRSTPPTSLPSVHDIIADIVENRRVMLIGHTGAGKTSLIEQVAARSKHGVLRSNMNGQTTVSDFVGFWTVKGGETIGSTACCRLPCAKGSG